MFPKPVPYSEYTQSSIDWIGSIPSHWRVRRIKTLFREKENRQGDGDGILLSLTRAKGIIPQSEASNRIAGVEDLAKYKVCNCGDLVMNRMQAWNGMFALSKCKGVISPDYSIFESISGIYAKYFEHLFKTGLYVSQFAILSKGIGTGFNRLYTPDFGSVHAIVPPLSEQSSIVRYLDHVDRDIRKYIRAKQKLIKLLEEQKQAIIHQAVTWGLNPDVPMKPSGVEWLGEVPAHWKPKRLKHISKEITVGVVVNPSSYFTDVGIPMLLGNNIRAGKINHSNVRRISEESNQKLKKSKLYTGDLVVVRVGAPGTTSVIPPELNESNCASMVIVRKDKCFDSKWLEYVFNSRVIHNQVDVVKYGAAQKQFNIAHAVNFWVCLPPLREQIEIVDKLQGSICIIEEVIEKSIKEIDYLRLYRTRLIADVVTGKVDVRDIAARLPEIDESDILEEAVLNDEIVDTEEAELSEEDTDADE